MQCAGSLRHRRFGQTGVRFGVAALRKQVCEAGAYEPRVASNIECSRVPDVPRPGCICLARQVPAGSTCGHRCHTRHLHCIAAGVHSHVLRQYHRACHMSCHCHRAESDGVLAGSPRATSMQRTSSPRARRATGPQSAPTRSRHSASASGTRTSRRRSWQTARRARAAWPAACSSSTTRYVPACPVLGVLYVFWGWG